jgi:hypothetical protein
MLKKLLTSTTLSLVAIGGFFVSMDFWDNSMVISQVHAACIDAFWNTPWSTGYDASTAGAGCVADQTKNLYNQWVLYLNQALYALTFLVSPAIMLAGWLMSPDWTTGDLFGIRPVIHNLWVIVSNITYLIYAILLIFIALATIFNSQNYGYKRLLPRLALGIILVPLTWWFVQFTISLASVVTTSVINIPLETLNTMYDQRFGPGNTNTWYTKESIPRVVVHDAAFSWASSFTGLSLEQCGANPGACISPQEVLTSSTGMYGGLMVYAYGIFRFQDVFQINTTRDALNVIVQLIHQWLVMALMFLVFGLLTMALVVLLLMRAIKLWFYAIFSPIMTLQYVIGNGIFGKENSETFDYKEFLWLAFVPAVVWLALSFGLVIIASLHLTGSGTPGNPNPNANCMTNGWCQVNIMWTNNYIRSEQFGTGPGAYTATTIYFWWIYYQYLWSVSGVSSAVGNVVPSALSAAGWFFGTIIIDLIALIFIWWAFMAAKNITKVAGAAITPFEQFGKKIWGAVSGLPKYIPLPIPGGSVAGMQKTVDLADSKLKTAMDQRAMNSIEKTFPGLVTGIVKPEEMAQLSSAVTDLTKKIVDKSGAEDVLSRAGKTQNTGEFTLENSKKIQAELSRAYKEKTDQFDQYIRSRQDLSDDMKEKMTKYLKREDLDMGARNKVWAEISKLSGKTPEATRAEVLNNAVKVNYNKDAKSLALSLPGGVISVQEDGTISPSDLTKLSKEIKDVNLTPEEFKKAVSDNIISATGGGINGERAWKIAEKVGEALKDKLKGTKPAEDPKKT